MNTIVNKVFEPLRQKYATSDVDMKLFLMSLFNDQDVFESLEQLESMREYDYNIDFYNQDNLYDRQYFDIDFDGLKNDVDYKQVEYRYEYDAEFPKLHLVIEIDNKFYKFSTHVNSYGIGFYDKIDKDVIKVKAKKKTITQYK